MPKTLGPHSTRGRGFWAQEPITLAGPVDVYVIRPPYYVQQWIYPEPATRTWIQSLNLNLLPTGLPVGEILTALPPYPPQPSAPFAQYSLNLNLLAAVVALPVGEAITALPPSGYSPLPLQPVTYGLNLNLFPPPTPPVTETAQVRAPHFTPPRPYPPSGPSWTWWTPLTLSVAPVVFPAGEQVFDLPPRGYPEPATRTWTWAYNLNLIGADQLPIGDRVYDRPSLGPEQPLRGWAWSYNLNLIGKDQLPVGEQRLDLPPTGYTYPTQLRTWTAWYNLNLIGQDRMTVGDQFYERPPLGPIQPLRSWTWSYNLNLIGQDALPVGERLFDLPPTGPQYPVSLRTWTGVSVPQVVITVPFNQEDWPINLGPQQPLRSWTYSYNLNLIGQDRLPTGEQVYDLPPKGYAQPANTWTWAYNLNLIGKDQLPVGEQRVELPPTGYIYPNDIRTWINRVNLALTTQAAVLPFNQFDWPTPKWPQQPAKSWTWSYNLDLIGQDRLPTGDQVTDLPPRAHTYYNDNRTWITRVNLALTTRVIPFNQFDWPNPKIAPQPQSNRSWTQSFNLNLIGKDRLPTGDQFYDRPMLAPIFVDRAFTFNLSRALLIPPAAMPFNQFDWPLPAGHAIQLRERYYDRSFLSERNINLFPFTSPIPPVPEPTPPEPSTGQPIPGLEWQFYDRSREPGPMGWR